MIPRLLVRKSLRDLRQGWLSFGACALITALACALFVAFSASFVNVGRAAEQSYQRQRFMDFMLQVDPQPVTAAARIRQVPGVKTAMARVALDGGILMDPLPMPASRSRRLDARILGVPHDRRPALNDVYLHEGRYLGSARGEALLERRFAEVHGLGVGDVLRLEHHGRELRFTVVGLVSSPEFLWLVTDLYDPRPAARRLAVVFVSETDAGLLAGHGLINEIHVQVEDPDQRHEVMEACARQFEGRLAEQPIPREEQPSHALLVRDRRAFAGVATLFPSVFLALSALILAITMWQLVTRQRRQMGILMALGFSARQLLAHYLGLALLLGGAGGLAGTLAGHVLGQVCTRFYASVQGVPFVETPLVAQPMLVALAVAMATSLLAGWWASERLLHMHPARAVRPEFSSHGRGALRVLASAPMWLRLPLRNLLRQPGRSAVAALGIASAVAQILMALAFLDSQEAAVRFSFDRVYAYDLRVGLNGAHAPSELPPVASYPGVQRVEGYLRLRAVLRHEGREVRTALWGIPGSASLLRLYDQRQDPLRSPSGNALLLGPGMLGILGAQPGDSVEVLLPGGAGQREPRAWKWVLGPEIYEPITNPGKVSLHHLQRQSASSLGTPSSAVNMLFVQVDPDRLDAVRRRLQREPMVGSVMDMGDMRRDIEDLMRMLQAYKGLMLAFASILALAILIGTTTMNVMDRAHEVATMSILGVPRGMLLLMLAVESGLLWLVGMALGVPAGTALGSWLVNNYQSEVIQLALTVRPETLAGTAASSLLLCGAAVVHALRAVQRIPLSEATQDRLG